MRAAFAREDLLFRESAVAGIEWFLPDRTLARDSAAVLGAGAPRGADLWHVAAALYVAPRPAGLAFATLDARQAAVASALGFPLPWESGEA